MDGVVDGVELVVVDEGSGEVDELVGEDVVDDVELLVLDDVEDDVLLLDVDVVELELVDELVEDDVLELVGWMVMVDDVEVLVDDDVEDEVVLLVAAMVVLVEGQSRTQVAEVSPPPQTPSPQHTLTGFTVQLGPHRLTSQPTGFVPALPQQ